MIAHYLAAALAKFGKAPFTTAANVLMLALGLVCFIAAWGIASYWGSADDYHPNADRIFAVNQRSTPVGEPVVPRINVPMSSAVLAPYLAEDFPELGPVVRVNPQGSVAVAAGERKARMSSANVDPAFLQMFDLEFIAGDPAAALKDANSVVLTQDAAARLFGDRPALGETLLVNASRNLTVTGVIKPVRQPSFMGARDDAILQFDIITHLSANPDIESRATWSGLAVFTFVTLPPMLSRETFDRRLVDFAARRVPADVRAVTTLTYTATPLGDVAVSSVNNEVLGRSGLNLSLGAVLVGLGLMTLLVACVNYATLATAQAAGRAKEYGMRKVVGAGRGHVMAQAWFEAGVLTLLALGVAIAVAALAAPVIASSTGIDILHFLSQGATPALVLTALLAAVTLAAGAYPALVLAAVRPSEALQAGRSRSGPRFVAKILVGVQFASASFLLILVTVSQLQRAHLDDVALAPREDPIATLPRLKGLGIDYGAFRARMLAQPGVKSMTVSDWAPWAGAFNVIDLARSPEAGAKRPFAFAKHVGYDYFETLNVRLLAGRMFEQERDRKVNLLRTDPSETPPIIIDDAYADSLGFASPAAAVGQIVYAPSNSIARRGAPAQPFEIIGVTEVATMRLKASDKVGGVYAYNPDDFSQVPIIRLDGADVARSVAAVTAVWDEFAPDIPADVRFFDQLFEASFASHARVNQIFVSLAGAAFIIASVGILGMAVHVVSRRRHEIGVRKILGSTMPGIIRLLLIDFSKPVFVANLLAWPLGYFAAQAYLAGFADRIDLSPTPFALSMAITLAIAWAAIIGEVLKAAATRPAEVLRQA